MKRCPTCQSTYTDDSLRFCLQDGTHLERVSETPHSLEAQAGARQGEEVRADDPPPTEILDVRAAPTARMPVAAQTEVAPSRATQKAPQPVLASASQTSSSTPALNMIMLGIIALLLMGAGLILALWLRSAADANRNRVAGENSQGASTNDGRRSGPDKISATASSTRAALAGNTYEASNVIDGRLMTAWAEGVAGPGLGEWVRCDFGVETTLQRISIAPGYFKSPEIWARNNRVAAATFYFSDGSARQFRFPDLMEEQILEVGAVKTSWVRVVIDEVYAGTDPDTAISQIAFEWAR